MKPFLFCFCLPFFFLLRKNVGGRGGGGAASPWCRRPWDSFKWFKIYLNLMKISLKAIMQVVKKDKFLKLIFNIQKIFMIFTMIYTFYLKEWKLEKLKYLQPTYMIKKNISYTRNLELALNHRLILKKVHRVIKFNQKAWLKLYIDLNIKL